MWAFKITGPQEAAVVTGSHQQIQKRSVHGWCRYKWIQILPTLPELARKAEGGNRLQQLHGVYRHRCRSPHDGRTSLWSTYFSVRWTVYDWESHQTWFSNPYPWKILLIIVLFSKLLLLPTKVGGALGLQAAVGWGLIIKCFLMIVTLIFLMEASHGQSKERTLLAASSLSFPSTVRMYWLLTSVKKILSWIFEFAIDFIFDFTVLDHSPFSIKKQNK